MNRSTFKPQLTLTTTATTTTTMATAVLSTSTSKPMPMPTLAIPGCQQQHKHNWQRLIYAKYLQLSSLFQIIPECYLLQSFQNDELIDTGDDYMASRGLLKFVNTFNCCCCYYNNNCTCGAPF